MDAVPSGDVPLAILRHRLVDTNDLDEKIVIINEINLMIKVNVHVVSYLPFNGSVSNCVRTNCI